MKRDRVSIGQCYEKDDHVYTVIQLWINDTWMLEDTLSKVRISYLEKDILKLRRPFENFG